ncbi:hypothetical protein KUTeg_022732 [Tegillarca granosa]|uniref:C2H2-type domain-containing protein n=1 Tax=Tegillarca granosa TaxID=220873 RepID=A0ABQ9E073_TEGGR|nr:hypothetical protein KUTeg_022732 [Tegillarca granosa]
MKMSFSTIIILKVYPLFSAAKLEVPDGCPFNKERDMYAVQEEHKYMETMSKWQCDFCGKAFVSEYYLDQHFTNRHSDYIRTNLMDKCIPAGLSSNMTSSIKDQLYNNTCSYLTCKNYWEAPPSIESDGTVMYIVFTFFLIVVMIVYYCVAYHYFYTDTFSDSYDSRYYDKHRSSFPMSSLRESELRLRTRNR